MIIHLIKKDILLIKNYLILFPIFSIAISLFVSSKITLAGMDYLGLLISEVLITFIFYGSVSIKEQKTKGSILICTTPYTRKLFVISKYLFILTLFVSCLLIYVLTSFFNFTHLPPVTITSVGISLLIIAIYFGISIPLEFKFGYDATRYITVIAVMSSTFLLPLILKWLAENNIDLGNLHIPTFMGQIVLYVTSFVIYYVSIVVSINIYSRKNL